MIDIKVSLGGKLSEIYFSASALALERKIHPEIEPNNTKLAVRCPICSRKMIFLLPGKINVASAYYKLKTNGDKKVRFPCDHIIDLFSVDYTDVELD